MTALSCALLLIGTSLMASEYWSVLKPIKNILAPDVVKIESGVKELSFMPPGGTSATLDSTEPGFNEILNVILNHDKNNLPIVREITQRLDFEAQFYWQQKGPIGTIFLNSKAGADKRDEVHPVNFTSTVFGWIEQERIKRLTVDSFIWLFWGALSALLACFFSIGNKAHGALNRNGRSHQPIRSIIWFISSYIVFVAIAAKFIDSKDLAMVCLTAALVWITAYYALLTHGILFQSKESSRAGIRPLVIGSRLSKEGEIGIYASNEGMNKDIFIINVGAGHAHNVNIRISPPAEAVALATSGRVKENSIFVLQGMEFPVRSKRMWNDKGGFCGGGTNWHYMYAEYEDIEGNQYYTIQSGYNVKTGKIQELPQRKRRSDQDTIWINVELESWLNYVDSSLKQWAEQQREIYQRRTVLDSRSQSA